MVNESVQKEGVPITESPKVAAAAIIREEQSKLLKRIDIAENPQKKGWVTELGNEPLIGDGLLRAKKREGRLARMGDFVEKNEGDPNLSDEVAEFLQDRLEAKQGQLRKAVETKNILDGQMETLPEEDKKDFELKRKRYVKEKQILNGAESAIVAGEQFAEGIMDSQRKAVDRAESELDNTVMMTLRSEWAKQAIVEKTAAREIRRLRHAQVAYPPPPS